MGRECGLIRKKETKAQKREKHIYFPFCHHWLFPSEQSNTDSCPYRAQFLKIPAFLALQHFVLKKKKETSNKCKIQPGLLNIFKQAHNMSALSCDGQRFGLNVSCLLDPQLSVSQSVSPCPLELCRNRKGG